MSLDIPEQVRKTVIADGNESWLDELPGMVDSLAKEWSLTIGRSLEGGHVALVVEVTLDDGTPAVLQSRATDETGYVQPTKEQIIAERGALDGQFYHMNGIQSWGVAADGSVKNVHPLG